ncbi:nose resistant to fluoxetine protein 6-like isoform X1 [Mya arenaria]|uniref:nose resistant to fluoxetine protein 6-like isoform X1 n=1 Tax=Mya arenaria TaxID=6604 RepID=UPI0022E6D9DA|nr:nose resistant to fluoxetine protein 6-like isoform X1 [Mya arenaria]
MFRQTLWCILIVSFSKHISCQNNHVFGDFLKEINYAHGVRKSVDRYSKELNSFQNAMKGTTDMAAEPSKTTDDTIQQAVFLLGKSLAAPEFNVSEECTNSTNLVLQELTAGQTWAVRMVDAAGKPPSGLFDLHTTWLGDWEECLAIEPLVNDTRNNIPYKPFDTQYCTATFPVGSKDSAASILTGGNTINIFVGVCVPLTCSNWSTAILIHNALQAIPSNITKDIVGPYVTCQQNSLPWSSNAIVVLVICGLFAFVMLAATAYDVLIQHVLSVQPKGYSSLPSNNYDDYKNHSKMNGNTGNGYVPNGSVPNGHVVDETTPILEGSVGRVSHSGRDMKKLEHGDHVMTKYQPGMAGRLLLSFSVYTNAQKILSTSQPAKTLTSINGIRFISMLWVVLGHTYAFGLQIIDNGATFLPAALKRFSFQAISNATFAVDTFFVLSGLLVAYLTLREMKKCGGAKKFNWGMFYFHRFWRLTPPYMLFLMFYIPLVKHWGNGPIWPQQGIEINDCKDTWWTNLLYVNNLVRTDKMCMGWSWYLANDMQFYVISPLMLILLYTSRLWGAICCGAFVLLNFIVAGVLSKVNHLPSNFVLGDNGGDDFNLLYIKPWCRVGPYAVGIFTGYVLYRTECKVRIPKVWNLLGWAIATAVALAILYGLWTPDLTPKLGEDMSALYNATARTAWGACIAWVIFSCATGHGGPVNALLSWKAIIPLSRLTYCCYLVHPVVMYTYYYSRRTLMHWYDLDLSYLFLGNLCLSYAVAFVVSLAFESPMMGLEKVVLGRGKNS